MARPQSNPFQYDTFYKDTIDRLNSLLIHTVSGLPGSYGHPQQEQTQTQQKKGKLTAMDFYLGVGFNKGYIEPNTIKD